MIYETLMISDENKYYASVKNDLYGIYRPKIQPNFSEKFDKILDYYKNFKNPELIKLDYITIKSKHMKKSDLKCIDGFYYIGDIIDVDGNPWVDEETVELILLEVNAGVTE